MGDIVFFEIQPWEETYIQKLFNSPAFYTLQKAHDVTDAKFLSASIISPFIYSDLHANTLAKFPNLKLIVTRSTGYDHIDIAYCKQKGITVENVPSYGSHTVAEHTFALLLAISRKLLPTVERSRKGNFSLEGLRGFELYGKTIGIVGAGKIGSKVIELALCFGMNVLIYTKHPDSVQRERAQYVSFDTLIQSSDIVSLHVPYTQETHHIINRETIKKFKKGSILINTARGPLVETQAILEGLETKILKAVGLDVLEEECSLKEERELLTDDFLKQCDIKTQLLNHVLLTRDDVLFTSHNGFNSDEALQQILHITIDNIIAYVAKTPKNVVSV